MIEAKIVADSISSAGKRITSFEVNLPKVLLAEFNTHRMVSKNWSSSRAIPTAAFVDLPSFEPVYWGANQSGMCAKAEEIGDVEAAKRIWNTAIGDCKKASSELQRAGLHKQWANRPNDWHTMARGVATATEWQNFFNLRMHADAQPEIRLLAESMSMQIADSVPFELGANEWHLPYIQRHRASLDRLVYSTEVDGTIDLDSARVISASCCAQVSYRKNDTSLEKAQRVFSMLNIGSKETIPHFSPLEHQATPMSDVPGFIPGVTHMDRNAKFWSANFCGWIQYRQLVMVQENINCMG